MPPGLTTPISAPPLSGSASDSRSELATRVPIADGAARFSAHGAVPPRQARVMSAVTEPIGWLPMTAAWASAASVIVFTKATRG